MRSLLTLIVIAALACARDDSLRQPDSTPSSRPVSLPGTRWTLNLLKGQPILPGTNVTLQFDSAGAGGYGGCNWYGGSYVAGPDSLVVGQITTTMRGCLQPAGVAEQEQAFYSTLQRVAAYRMSSGRLELLGAGDTVLAVFAERERLAMNPADLVGTHWTLRAVNDSAVTVQPHVTLSFGDSTTSGFGGCREFTGTYRATGDDIRFTSTHMASMECSRGIVAQRREEQFTTDMSESSHYRLSGDSLQIHTFPGRELRFVRKGR